MNTTKNKGQVTLFVIVGAVILLVAGLVIYLQTDISEDRPGVDIPDVSLESRPAVELITQCLETTSNDALQMVGSQGGYIQSVSPSYPSYKGKAVSFTPYTVPFWRHLTSENCQPSTGCDASQQPPLCDTQTRTCSYLPLSQTARVPSIEEQLETYVITHIDTCINDFSTLEMYDIELQDEPEVNVIFARETTEFLLEYPIIIRSLTQEGNTKEVESFRASFDVPLQQMYQMADEIIALERNTNFYEHKTMDLVDMYSGLDEPLPPTNAMTTFLSNAGPWVQENVKQILQNDLLPLITLVSYVNSDNPMRI